MTSAHGRIVKDAREKVSILPSFFSRKEKGRKKRFFEFKRNFQGYMTRMHGTFRDCTQESLSLFQKCLNAGANIISSDCVECDLIPFS